MRQLAFPVLLLTLTVVNPLVAHADSPDAKAQAQSEDFEFRANAIKEKINKAALHYTRGKNDRVVKLLEGLDQKIDAVAAEFPNEKSKWMPGVKKVSAYCLLAAAYRAKDEREKFGKYEALVVKPFKAVGQDQDFDEFLRLVLQDAGAIPLGPEIEVELVPIEPEKDQDRAIDSGQSEGSLSEEQRGDQPEVKQPQQRTQAIELFVDLALGVCDEQTAKKRLKTLQVQDLIAAVKAEIEGLQGDLVGIRQVTGEQFAALTRRMKIISSSISIATLGVTRDRAYLEVSVILTSKHAYVAVVTTELGGLPEEIVNKLKHADSPDGKADKEIQFDLPVPEVDVEPGEVEPELTLILPDLLGTWKHVSENGAPPTVGSEVTFQANGMGIVAIARKRGKEPLKIRFKYTADGKSLVINNETQPAPVRATYAIDGKVLTVTAVGKGTIDKYERVVAVERKEDAKEE